MTSALLGCLIVLLPGGGFASHEPSPNAQALRDAGARVVVHRYPLQDVRAAYKSARFPRAVLVGESAGGVVAAWAVAHRRARAAVTVGAPLDLRLWAPPHMFPLTQLDGRDPWVWSPHRAYRGQRPLTTIEWDQDPVIPPTPKTRWEHRVTLNGNGHHRAPVRVLIREVAELCGHHAGGSSSTSTASTGPGPK